MANAIDKSALEGAAQQYRRELLTLATTDLEVLPHMTLAAGIKDEYKITQLKFNSLLKPYTSTWTATQKGVLTPRTLKVRLGNVELEEEPLTYRNEWLGMLLQQGVNAKDHPFEREFLMEVAKKAKEDINNSLVFYGEHNASGTAAADVNDGFFKIIDDAITAGDISVANGNLISTGAITSSNAVDKLKEMYRGINKAYRRVPVKMYMSWETYDKYVDDYQNSVGAVVYNASFDKRFLEGSNGLCEMVPLTAMGSTQRVIIAPQSNMFVGVDLASDQERVGVWDANSPYKIGFFMLFAFGVQIGSLDAIWVNDQNEDSASASAS